MEFCGNPQIQTLPWWIAVKTSISPAAQRPPWPQQQIPLDFFAFFDLTWTSATGMEFMDFRDGLRWIVDNGQFMIHHWWFMMMMMMMMMMMGRFCLWVILRDPIDQEKVMLCYKTIISADKDVFWARFGRPQSFPKKAATSYKTHFQVSLVIQWGFQFMGGTPDIIIHFHRIFPYKPSSY